MKVNEDFAYDLSGDGPTGVWSGLLLPSGVYLVENLGSEALDRGELSDGLRECPAEVTLPPL